MMRFARLTRRMGRCPAMGHRWHCSGASRPSKQTHRPKTGTGRGTSTNSRRGGSLASASQTFSGSPFPGLDHHRGRFELGRLDEQVGDLRGSLLPAEIVGLPMKASRSRARDLLNLVGLAGYEDKYPQQLSGGMQQRTAIARAFIHDPKLILMDEPFGALDALTREQMNLEMLRIWRESGKTIIFVTHSIQEAVFLASHCAVLTAGPARMAEYFPIDLPFPRALPIKTTDEFGAYARRIYASLGLGSG
jgi:ABC-type dipeptide/oligopeptide/nickel transport system ATPase component